VVVLKIISDSAGLVIASRWAVVIRGIKTPLLVLFTSNIADESGSLPSLLTDTCASNKYVVSSAVIIKNVLNVFIY
jgi:hypothetical protein